MTTNTTKINNIGTRYSFSGSFSAQNNTNRGFNTNVPAGRYIAICTIGGFKSNSDFCDAYLQNGTYTSVVHYSKNSGRQISMIGIVGLVDVANSTNSLNIVVYATSTITASYTVLLVRLL